MSSKAKLSQTPAKRERACAVCVQNGKVLLVRLRDRLSGVNFLTPPGGAIEPSESPLQAAIRETAEETGYIVRASSVDPVVAHYDFEWEGRLYNCTTSFFRCDLIDPNQSAMRVSDTDYNLGAFWLSTEDALSALEYHASIKAAVENCLNQAKRTSLI